MTYRERESVGRLLPDFPWDTIADVKSVAAQHPQGLINLSVGTPIDPVAPAIQEALAGAAAAPGYPQTHGTQRLRDAIIAACQRRYNVSGLTDASVLPVIGTKEAIANLPAMLGVGAGHTVVIPEVAYPTYEVAALVAGARVVRADSLTQLGPSRPTLMFINSPSNPTGKVLGVNHLKKVVDWHRERGCIVASDECYIGLGWDKDNKPLSILDDEVCGGDRTGLLAIHSLSKSSNLAGYRAGFLAGDDALITELLGVRKHCGYMMPGPIQAAMVAALNDDAQEKVQYNRYKARREVLASALRDAGFTIDNSEAGLYLWVTRGEDSRTTLDWFARRGILVAPGDFYGPKGAHHVRIALTGSDADIEAAGARIVADV